MHALTPEQVQIVDTVRRFVDREVMPTAASFEHADEYPTPLVERMKELGLFGATIPPEYGGLGLDVTTYAMVVEELCRGWMSLSGVLNTHLMLAFVLKTLGTAEQKRALSAGHGARRAPCARSASPSRTPAATCSASARRPSARAITTS